LRFFFQPVCLSCTGPTLSIRQTRSPESKVSSVDPVTREFALSMVTFADTVGILGAAMAAIPDTKFRAFGTHLERSEVDANVNEYHIEGRMGWFRLLLMTILQATAVRFPCGPSFIPCETKAFGIKSVGDTAENDADKSVFNDGDKGKEHRLEVSKLMSKQQLLQVVHEANDEVENLFNQTENGLHKITLENSFSSAELSWAQYTKGDRYSKYLSFSALMSIKATQKIALLSPTAHLDDIIFVSLNGSAIENNCPVSQIEECAPEKYRTFSGHCNNAKNSHYGAAYEPLRRLILPDYEDKISKPRISSTEVQLPSAGEVAALFTPAPRNHMSCSLMLAQWASFLYDDMVYVATSQLSDGGFFSGSKNFPLPCCHKSVKHPECFPITGADGKCRSRLYSRSLPTPRRNCTLGTREQGNMVARLFIPHFTVDFIATLILNIKLFGPSITSLRLVSAYIDASQIYGTSREVAAKLRSFKDGE
uniref:Lipase_3 domain-containing protein n=1 Tax=Angiostrongylus cantonensis TaxID=6313 RepID=A0A158P7N4_ANGCA